VKNLLLRGKSSQLSRTETGGSGFLYVDPLDHLKSKVASAVAL